MIPQKFKKSGRCPSSGFLFYPLCLLLVLFVFSPLLAGAGENIALSGLIESSRQKKLGDDPYWWILLHYKKTVFGVASVVDDPSFFLAPDGKNNPQAELEALIRTYFDPEKKDQAPSVCKYIARYTWVKENLAPDATTIPLFTCPEVEDLKPRAATLIFPTYYLNSPTSMFGHTLITVETGYGSSLLTNAVNYAADPEGANSLQYTVYGIFGGFKGYFSILPYYKKIQQYSDMDQRDIWEYPLNLTDAELKRMVLHIREMQGVYSDYYFFKENCSYHLLFLLEAARPSLNLSDTFGASTIPIDTVKRMKQQGLIGNAIFRPSNGTKIRQKLSLLSEDEQDLVFDVCEGEKSPSLIDQRIPDRERKIIASDLTGEYLKHKLIKRQMTRDQYQSIVLPNLKLRSTLGSVDESRYNVSPPPDPVLSHDSSRLTVSAGMADGKWFQAVGVNPAFTDLLNTDYTRLEGVELRIFDATVRYEDEDNKLRLEQFDILDIVSLFPRSRFFKPLSWKISAGLRREAVTRDQKDRVVRVNGGAGYSFQLPYAGLFYIMPEAELRAGKGLEHDVAAGAGMGIGLMNDIRPWWGVLLSAQTMYFAPGQDYRENLLRLDQNFRLDRNNRIQLTVFRKEAFGSGYYEGSLSWQRFF
ncbi:MAG: DUF4105 domain-containing protein [Desulfobacteraceae bacterium]|jgi:hypothetical protein